MTFADNTITLTPAEIKQMFETKPTNTGRSWNEYEIKHTYLDADGKDVEIICYFLTMIIEHGVWNRDPTMDTSWNEEVVDTDTVEFEVYAESDGYYELDEESVNGIIKQLNTINF